MKHIATLSLFVFASVQAVAQSASVQAACAQFERETTSANQFLCEQAAYHEADVELNRQYRELLIKIDRHHNAADVKAAAVAAQRAWLVLRDRTCELVSVSSGLARKYRPPICLTELTKVRTKELARLMECWNAGGDACALR